jgi:hypothetical protein
MSSGACGGAHQRLRRCLRGIARVLPLGADDLDRATPPLAFRSAREDDS